MDVVIVGSENPVKVAGTAAGFQKVFGPERFCIRGISIATGVSAQPRTDRETYRGAFTRATSAKRLMPGGTYWVGIEGGVHKTRQGTQSCAWIVVLGKGRMVGRSRTATFYLPDVISRLVDRGKELGDANDEVFALRNSKQNIGAIGLLTHRVITREKLYAEAVVCALIPFVNTPLYGNEQRERQ